jgi:rhomboid protease GluP
MTGLQFVYPQLLPALERRPTALAQHEWWRLITPLLVHPDGWSQISFNFPAILIVGALTERIYGSLRFLILYLLGGLVGEVAGYLWQPFGAGASIAGAGALGALAFWLLLRNGPVQARFGGAFVLTGAILLTLNRDIHGPPILVGACAAGLMHRQDKRL